MRLVSPFVLTTLCCLVAEEIKIVWAKGTAVYVSQVVSDLIGNDSVSVCHMQMDSENSCADRNSLIRASFEEHMNTYPCKEASDAVQSGGNPFSEFYTPASKGRRCQDLSEYRYIIDLNCVHEYAPLSL